MEPRIKRSFLRVARAGGLFAMARRATRKHLRILAYHGLWTTPGYQYGNHLFVTPEHFEERMIWLKGSGYPVLPLGEAVQRLDDGSLPDCAVAITIDDGWNSAHSHMLPILEELGLPATLYVTTWYSANQLPVVNVAVDYILKRAGHSPSPMADITREITNLPSLAERERGLRDVARRFAVTVDEWWSNRQFHLMDAAQIHDADQRGLDIQLHTHRHRLGEDFAQEIADNREYLARACGRPSHSFDRFCYPGGIYDDRAQQVLRSNEIKSATLVDTGINAPGANPLTLRRFLDGRLISQELFEAYLSGALEVYQRAKPGLRGRTSRTPT